MSETTWLRPNEQDAWLGWMGAAHLLDSALDHQLRRDSGLTHRSYGIMAVLSAAPERTLRMADMAVMTHSSQSRISHAVDRLENSGWVRRSRNPTDNREVLATLTVDGLAALQDAAPGHAAMVRRLVFERLDDEQIAAMARVGETVLQALGEAGYKVPASLATGHPSVSAT